jgi:hypothetical protein
MLVWRDVEVTNSCGVIIASNEKQEWLLPWWWENYTQHNAFPVTFVDFGLSEEGKDFCRQRGEVVEIPFLPSIGAKEEAEEEKGKFWEATYGSSTWWDKRNFWHKKPIALLQTPYQHTLWLDIDCEVHASLAPLFRQIAEKEAILLCPEPEEAQEYDREKGHIFPDEVLFNSGVIGFTKGSSHIMEWAHHTLKEHGSYLGDQNLLSRLIYEKKWPVQILDRLYNWRQITHGKHPDVKITHWVGESGKFFISLKKHHFLR